MADNYLEKKMEELRSGRLGTTKTTGHSARPRNVLSFPFRELRVLVVFGKRKHIAQYAEAFRNHGCRLAAFGETDPVLTDLGPDHGIRLYNLCHTEAGAAFASLVKAWRDIDVVVMLDENAEVRELLEAHRTSIPYPNDWGMPVITVEEGLVSRDGRKIIRPVPDSPGRNEPGTLPYLSLRDNSFIASISLF